MNKTIFLLICFLSLTTHAVAPKRSRRLAQEENTSTKVVTNKSAQSLATTKYYIGLESATWDYTEEVNGKRFMQDKGQLFGVVAQAQFALIEDYLFTQGNFSYLTGATQYDGSLQSTDGSPNEPYQAKTRNDIMEARAQLAGAMSYLPNHAITPSVGINYRSLVNPESEKDKHDYTRHAEYLTAPVGIGFMGSFETFSYGLSAAHHYLLEAQTTSYLTKEIGVIKSKQEKGEGREINGFIGFKVAENNNFKIGLYHREWSFEDSKAVRSGNLELIEPKNKTQMSGINFSIGF